MKKLLSTIGLGIALMTGIAPSQAEAAISFVNTGTGPNTWTYELQLGATDTFNVGDIITLTTTGIMNGAGAPGVDWGISLAPGGLSATWTWGGATALGAGNYSGFSVSSFDPNGPVTWSYNGGAPVGTSGPVPEPATVMLLGIGGLLAGGRKLFEGRTEGVTA